MKLRKQLFSGYVLIFVFMIVIAVVTYLGVVSLTETADWVSHTHEVISKAYRIEKLLVDMETGERGFLITGQEEFLEPYINGIKAYEKAMADLKELVSDNPPRSSGSRRSRRLSPNGRTLLHSPRLLNEKKSSKEQSMPILRITTDQQRRT